MVMKNGKGLKGLVCAFFTFLLAVALVPTHALAAITATATGELTVNGVQSGDTVQLYKVVDATYDENTNGVTYAYHAGNEIDGMTVVQYMSLSDADQIKAAVEKMAVKRLTADPDKTATAAGDSVKVEGLSMGQYLIRVTPGEGNTGKVYQVSVGNVVPTVDNGEYTLKPATAQIKSESVTITKTIGEVAGAKTTDGYKTGDEIPFTIVATRPVYSDNAVRKVFVVGDTLPQGLELVENSVAVAGMTAGTDYTFAKVGNGFKITFNCDSAAVKAANSVTVTYNAKLTASNAGALTNEADLAYTREPFKSSDAQPGDGPDDEHKKDEATDYTYGLNVKKVDANNVNTTLKGAEFKLYLGDEAIKGADGNDLVLTTDDNGYASTDGQVALKAGTYTLVETKAPNGYQLPAGDAAKTTVVLSNENGNVTGTVTTTSTDAEGRTWDHKQTTVDNGQTNFVVQTVKNTPNGSLPTTGDMGTIGITAIGVALVAVSALVLSRVLRKE